MSKRADIVFLFDVDNTLIDNDRVQAHVSEHLEQTYGSATRDRYWQIFEELRSELGYADYLGALERYRTEDLHRPEVLRCSSRARSNDPACGRPSTIVFSSISTKRKSLTMSHASTLPVTM